VFLEHSQTGFHVFFDGFNPEKAFLTNGDWTQTDTLQRGTKPTVSWGDAM
jgi:hypothetical protein